MDRPITDAERRWMHRLPLYRQLFRWWIYWRQEIQAIGFTLRPAWMDWVQTLGLRFMKKNIKNPALRSLLTPDYRIGCKRILLSNDYYPALAQPNVTVHPASGMGGVGTKGILIDGQEQPVDAIIYGTGFRATDLYTPLKFMGRGGVDLNDTWAATGLQAYQGTLVAGYPNLFLLLGPNTGLGHNSIIFIIEAQVNYILRCIRSMKAQGQTAIEVTPQAQASYNQEVQKRTQGTVWGSGCKSWYLDAAGRNVTLWPGFTFSYWWRTLCLRRQHLRWSRAA
jgi:cation diffusion facilitator CzcD-associated flavoprotein CzcO